jgi:cyclopropane fatty-acyl-phospholipid synthase-like methyltransferase
VDLMSAKRESPAAQRNRAPIAQVLAEELPERGLVLEIASGTGEHAVHFARQFPDVDWQPSDPDAQARASIEAYAEEAALPNLRQPVALDASTEEWPIRSADALLCVNMVHISPWRASEGLFAGAAEILAEGAPLILYGPYIEAGVETAASNLAFDESLKARNPEWGLRDVAEIDTLARRSGFSRVRRVQMPANNIVLVYRRS